MTEKKSKMVMVTTERRGVFAGYLVGKLSAEKIVLRDARCCVYWTQSERGFLGLAAKGPGSGCRVGPAAPKVTLYGVTSVTEMTEAAAKRWEAEPWG